MGQIRDFRGLSIRSFDQSGSYTLGLKEQLIFPEINYEDINNTLGFSITFNFSSLKLTKKVGKENKILGCVVLMSLLRFPFNDCGYYDLSISNRNIEENWKKKKHLKRKRWSTE